MLVLCSAHHRGTHRGTLIIEGTASNGFRFLHADGSIYGGTVTPGAAAAGRDAFLALRHLGFGETAVRQALAAARTGGTELETAQLVRAALQQLRPMRRTTAGLQLVREAPVAYTAAAPTWAWGPTAESRTDANVASNRPQPWAA